MAERTILADGYDAIAYKVLFATFVHAFRKEFEELLDAAELDRLVVIVDDLDRCLPHTAIATLEAIRLSLMVDGTAFVIGAAELMIEYAVRDTFRICLRALAQ